MGKAYVFLPLSLCDYALTLCVACATVVPIGVSHPAEQLEDWQDTDREQAETSLPTTPVSFLQ